jgi:hypothetical protein
VSILDRSESRNGARVRLLAVHSTEGNGTAQQLRDAAWWTGSSHAINDEYGTLLTPAEGTVPYDRASWTLRSGNPISENIEQVGWARYTRADWLARPKLLDTTARWLADRSKARGIPLVKLSPGDVALGKAGVIGHVDWTVGAQDGTHTDPGPNYPWDVVIAKARAYAAPEEDDLPYTEAQLRKMIAEEVANAMNNPKVMDGAWQRARQIIDKFSVAPRTQQVLDAVHGLEDPPAPPPTT